MIIKKAELETVCGVTSTFPQNDHPEFAFAGKSNVGKSSLINGLLNRKALARTSSQPGKTQTINFYHINDELYFVDLPGYGYAKVTQEVKAKWGKMIERYLKSSLICFCRLPTAFQCQLPKYNQCSYPLCPQCKITMVREYQRFCDRCVKQLAWSKFEDAKEVYIGWDGVNKAYLP